MNQDPSPVDAPLVCLSIEDIENQLSAVNWMIAVIEGGDPEQLATLSASELPQYCTDDHLWAPLIQKHWIGLDRPSRGQKIPVFRALMDFTGSKPTGIFLVTVSSFHVNAGTAAMCCLVKSLNYKKIKVPAHLII